MPNSPENLSTWTAQSPIYRSDARPPRAVFGDADTERKRGAFLGVVVAILLPICICAVLLQAAVLLGHPEARVIDPTGIFFP